MKILVLNSHLDVTQYYQKHGIAIQVDYDTLPGVFPLQLVASKLNEFSVMTDFYSPDVMDSVRSIVKPLEYHAVIFAFNPSDYNSEIANTGGYTYGEDVYLGTQLSTVRLDGNEGLYAQHEMMHVICHRLERILFPVFDEMDSTLVNGVYEPYYLNSTPDAPGGNFAVTWGNLAPYLPHVEDMPPLLSVSNQKNGWAYSLQLQLLELGYTIGIADGYFGQKTLAAIRSVQEKNSLVVDGVVGPLTLACLK